MAGENKQDRSLLQRIADRVMRERGLWPDFSAAALKELAACGMPELIAGQETRDLRALLWASIDNDDSRDLDQLSVAESAGPESIKILVAIADVDSIVKRGDALDTQAAHNTTSVYTAAKIFPMLPEKLSTDLTSLNLNSDRLSIVVEMDIGLDGSIQSSDVYAAVVRNRAKLAYNSVSDWLEGKSAILPAIAAVPGLDQNLKLQDQAAQRMKNFRHSHGALSLETVEARPSFLGDAIQDLVVQRKNRATELIEDFMVAANGVIARYLAAKNFPCIRRVVRTPKRWDRIVEIAAAHSFTLPGEPDATALEAFLQKARAADPERFPDLSLTVIKLLGRGEYVAEVPGGSQPSGHFSLAVKDYAHSTAPNRRYTDLLTQRLLKAAFVSGKPPYGTDELRALAQHCTDAEDAANKVERAVSKSAAALLMQSKIGQRFDAIVTGVTDKGAWARILSMPVEGKLIQGAQGADVGDKIAVVLEATDVERGFIDFRKV